MKVFQTDVYAFIVVTILAAVFVSFLLIIGNSDAARNSGIRYMKTNEGLECVRLYSEGLSCNWEKYNQNK